MTKRQFILKTLQPYFENPNTCAINADGDCVFLEDTYDTKCAIGQWMNEGPHQYYQGDVSSLLNEYEAKNIFLPEAWKQIQTLDIQQLSCIQVVHDELAGWYNDNSDTYDPMKAIERCEFSLGISLKPLKTRFTKLAKLLKKAS